MIKAILTERLFNLENGQAYKAHINKGNDFTVAIITENGETTSYYTTDLIESVEEWNKGGFNLDPVGDDFEVWLWIEVEGAKEVK